MTISANSESSVGAVGSGSAVETPTAQLNLGAWSWLADVLCNTEDGRESVARPHTIQWNGSPYLVATNGKTMVVVPGDLGAAPAPEKTSSEALNILSKLPSVAPLTFAWAELRKFLDVPRPTDDGKCPTCLDARRTGDCEKCSGLGSYSCTCRECEDNHDADCDECEGEGEYICGTCRFDWQSNPSRVRLDGLVFNKHLLAPLAYWLDADVVEWRTGTMGKTEVLPFATITCPAWTLIAMPLRDDGVVKGTPIFAPLASHATGKSSAEREPAALPETNNA